MRVSHAQCVRVDRSGVPAGLHRPREYFRPLTLWNEISADAQRKLKLLVVGDGAEELVAVFVSTAATDGGDHDCTTGRCLLP